MPAGATITNYRLDLTPSRDAVAISFSTEDGAASQFTLPVGPSASEFIGKLIEQFQFAGNYMPAPPSENRMVDGVYPTYPLITGISWNIHPQTGERYPLLVVDYGGCVLAFAIDAASAEAALRVIAKMQPK
jgi:hypothetical protein